MPELPAISRASMTVQVVADTVALGFLRMSAPNARAFLTDLHERRSPIVAKGDEGGTVEIEWGVTGSAPVLLVRKPGQEHALRRCIIDRGFDLESVADELLADLGAKAVHS